MNTPRTKKPVRYSDGRVVATFPAGAYSQGIHNASIAEGLGKLTAAWVHVEGDMTWIFGHLIGVSNWNSAWQIFRSIINQQGRIKVMRTMLEKSPTNDKADAFFDEVLNDFEKLNASRNRYIHGQWWTHQGNNKVFFKESDETVLYNYAVREVKRKELDAVMTRMSELSRKINDWQGHNAIIDEPDSSPPKSQ